MREPEKRGNWKFLIGAGAGAGIVVLVVIVSMILSGVSFGNKVAVINMKGTITFSPQLFTESVVPEDFFSMAEKIESDPSIRGVLVKINSPGGSPVASREMAHALKGMEKPTLCWMGDVAASGAYWVASSCDHVMADPLSMTGSIGVTASYLEFSGLFEKYGITYEQITSGERKDIASPFRNITAEERGKMEDMVSEIFRHFIDEVSANRNLSEEQIEEISSGDFYLGSKAVELGLVDSLGTVKDAEEKIRDMTGLEQVDFYKLEKKGLSLFDLIGML